MSRSAVAVRMLPRASRTHQGRWLSLVTVRPGMGVSPQGRSGTPIRVRPGR